MLTEVISLSLTEIQAGFKRDGTPLPPLPVPASPNDLPPDQSAPIVLGTSTEKLYLWFQYDNPPPGASADDRWIPGSPQSVDGGYEVLQVLLWPGYTLTHRQYWKRIDYQSLGPGASYSNAESIVSGISTTDSSSLSLELGLSVGSPIAQVSAKLTKTFSHSVAVFEEITKQSTWTINGSDSVTTVWVLWQLVDEIVALAPDGSVFTSSGQAVVQNGSITETGIVTLPTPSISVPSQVYASHPTTFPMTAHPTTFPMTASRE